MVDLDKKIVGGVFVDLVISIVSTKVGCGSKHTFCHLFFNCHLSAYRERIVDNQWNLPSFILEIVRATNSDKFCHF